MFLTTSSDLMPNTILSPKARANELLAKVIKPIFGGNYLLPIRVEEFILEYTKQRFPNDPITKIIGADLPGFEGMLRQKKDKTGWQIIYSTTNYSKGRIRFTQAHEFGHYLLHRNDQHTVFQCSEADMYAWDADESNIEKEADEFAAAFLMPTDDFRIQVENQKPSFDLLSHCANRYDVSLSAAMLKWVELSPKRAIVMAVRDDYVLWARSNTAALRSGAFLTARQKTISTPFNSILRSKNQKSKIGYNEIQARKWFKDEPPDMQLKEMSFVSDQHGFTLGILLLPEAEYPHWKFNKKS